MANWCTTRIDIQNQGNDLTELYNTIVSLLDNGDGTESSNLQDLITRSGVATFRTGAETDINCYGIIDEIEFDKDDPIVIMISVATLYVPNLLPWQMLLDKYCPEANMLYLAEEPGCRLFHTNDCCYANKWKVDIYDMPDDFPYQPCMDADDDYVVKLLQYILKSDYTNIDALLALFECSTEFQGKIYINQWSYVNY